MIIDPKIKRNKDSCVVVRFALQPHAWKFQKGHTIRFSIARADNINYEFNPAISADNTLENVNLPLDK